MSGRLGAAVVLGLVLAHVRHVAALPHVQLPVSLPPLPVLVLGASAALAAVGAVLVRLAVADRRAGLRSAARR